LTLNRDGGCKGRVGGGRGCVRVESGGGHHLLDVKALMTYALIIVEVKWDWA